MKKYPEHEKLENISQQSQFLGEFIEWCNEHGMFLARHIENFDSPIPVSKSINTLLGEFFEIDLIKLEQEKRKMLEDIRSKQS